VSDAKRREAQLRLVSWNVHGTPVAPRISERLDAVAGAVLARKPAVVLFQEVWRRSDATWLEKRFARKGYEVVGVPNGGLLMRKAGLLAFVHARAGWRADAARFHEFSAEASDWKVWEGDGLGDKGVQGFTVSREGLAFDVLHTHLQAAYQEGGYAEVRRAQLRELRALVATVQDRPVLVAGDLNTAPDEPAWQELADLRDLTATLRASCECGTSVPEAGETSRWIDYLLAHVPSGWDVEAKLSLLRSQRPDVPYSDHQGLDAVFRIAAPPAAPSLSALAAARLAAGPTTRRELLGSAALWLLGRGLGV
jgi:endonuclease/exonuclease/phosphatase family metal-dependent hydrolase